MATHKEANGIWDSLKDGDKVRVIRDDDTRNLIGIIEIRGEEKWVWWQPGDSDPGKHTEPWKQMLMSSWFTGENPSVAVYERKNEERVEWLREKIGEVPRTLAGSNDNREIHGHFVVSAGQHSKRVEHLLGPGFVEIQLPDERKTKMVIHTIEDFRDLMDKLTEAATFVWPEEIYDNPLYDDHQD